MTGVLRSILLLICTCFTCLGTSFAQSAYKADANSPAYKAELSFNSAIKQQSRLYNGPAYPDYAPSVDGSANFQNATTFANGVVVYQGFRFENVPLMYDIHQDKLVSLLSRFSKYSFVSENVTEFYLNDHHFKYITVLDSTKSVIKSGFYDLIHDGKSKVYVRRTKSMQYSLENKLIRYYFIPKTTYYIERNEQYSTISGEGSFLNYFKDRKPELKKLLREKNIKFRKQPEAAMVLLASYYESLTN
jgi:hypothetical protein